MDFNDLIYIRYNVRPAKPKATMAQLVKEVTGRDDPREMTEQEEQAVRDYRDRQAALSRALVRFWTWVKENPDDRDDDEKMLCRLDSEMSRAGFSVVDESITGVGDAFIEVPPQWG